MQVIKNTVANEHFELKLKELDAKMSEFPLKKLLILETAASIFPKHIYIYLRTIPETPPFIQKILKSEQPFRSYEASDKQIYKQTQDDLKVITPLFLVWGSKHCLLAS